MTHGHPLLLIAKLGIRWLLVAVAMFVVLNPVTWGVALALLDHMSGGSWGAWFFGFPP